MDQGLSSQQATPNVPLPKPPSTDDDSTALGKTEEKVFYATQWQLMWWKFRKHKVAMVSAVVIIFMYACAIFAPVIAPYAPTERHRGFLYVPPQKVRFWDENGFSLRPFVYPITQR